MKLKTRNLLCYESWMAGKPELAGTIIHSRRATEEDGYRLVKILREQGIEEVDRQLSEIEYKQF